MAAKSNKPRMLMHQGRTQTLEAWAKEVGISEGTIRTRLDRLGWIVERALATPVNTKFSRSPGRPQKGVPRTPPKLRQHVRGQAYVRWMEGGKRRCEYFGAWGSQEARDGYARFLRSWATGVQTRKVPLPAKGRATVSELIIRWLDHAKARYMKFGRQTSEYGNHKSACRVLINRFPHLPIAEFELTHLEAVREDMIHLRGWSRTNVNIQTSRIVAAFGWGVTRKLVPAEVHYTLQQLKWLTPGGSAAREPAPIRSAPPEHIQRVLEGEHLHPDPARRLVLRAMIQVHLLTGMRPNELCNMRPEYIDQSASEWKYTVPAEMNKNYHRQQQQTYWFGPRTQAILSPFIEAAKSSNLTVFHFARKRRISDPPRPIARLEYSRLIKDACKRAGVPPFHPHQLRHNKATDVKRVYESDLAASQAIGTTPDVAAQIYVDPHEAAARRIASQMG